MELVAEVVPSFIVWRAHERACFDGETSCRTPRKGVLRAQRDGRAAPLRGWLFRMRTTPPWIFLRRYERKNVDWLPDVPTLANQRTRVPTLPLVERIGQASSRCPLFRQQPSC